MNIRRTSSGSYTVEVFLGKDEKGKKIRKYFTGKDKKALIAKAAAFEDEHKAIHAADSFHTCMVKYLEESKDKLSPSTLRAYHTMSRTLENEFPKFCALRISLIDSDEMQAVLDGLGKTRSVKTVRNFYGLICSVYKANRLRTPVINIPKRDKPKLNIPDENTIHEILRLSYEQNRELWICVSLAVTGPMRAGEIGALQYTYDEAINFDTNTIHVSHNLAQTPDNKWVLKSPKTRSSDRYLTFPKEIMDEIKSQGYVTTKTPHAIYDCFRKFLIKNNLPTMRFHDLRHYCASMLHAKGYPDAYIMERTGHSTMDVLRNVYTHTLTDERKKISAEMMNDFENLIH